jgi:hypothetical protein
LDSFPGVNDGSPGVSAPIQNATALWRLGDRWFSRA